MSRSIRARGRGGRPPSPADDAPTDVSSLKTLLTQALVMEVEAARRYRDFADVMETSNNIPMTVLFRKMAAIEGHHAEQIMHEMGWATAPAAPGKHIWEGIATPSADAGVEPRIGGPLQPWQALSLALAAEERAERFFANLAQFATIDAVRNTARELQREEEEHVELIRAWMTRVVPPPLETSPGAMPLR